MTRRAKPRTLFICLLPLLIVFLFSPARAEVTVANLPQLVTQLEGGACRYMVTRGALEAAAPCTRTHFIKYVYFMQAPRKELCTHWAAACIAQLGQEAQDAVPSLIRALERNPVDFDTGDGDVPNHRSIVWALGRIGNPAAIPALVADLDRADTTYPEVTAESLGLFGDKARAAIPSLIRRIDQGQQVSLLPVYIGVLKRIDPESALALLVAELGGHSPGSERFRILLNAFRTFESIRPEYQTSLREILRKVDLRLLSGYEKSSYLELILKTGMASELTYQVKQLLTDPAVVAWVNPRSAAFGKEAVVPLVIQILDNFDMYFSEASLAEYRSWCGSKTTEGKKNAIRRNLLQFLVTACTHDSFAAYEAYRLKSDPRCVPLAQGCQEKLSPAQ